MTDQVCRVTTTNARRVSDGVPAEIPSPRKALVFRIWRGVGLLSFVSCFALAQPTQERGVTDELARCVVFLVARVTPGQTPKCGSGFLVCQGEIPALVTASHVAKGLGDKWRMVWPGDDGRKAFADVEGLTWAFSEVADVALTRLGAADSEQARFFRNRCISAELLSSRPLPPSRDIPLTVMGYPKGLGVNDFVSPLSLETKAASGFTTLERADNRQLATFMIVQNPSVEGLSGGPVFDLGNSYFGAGRRMVVRSGVSVVGLVHGTISDNTGGKLGLVVPATEIVPLLSAATRGTAESADKLR